MSRKISFFILLGIIIAVGILFYKVVAGFFVPLFLAALLAVLFRPVHRLLLKYTGNRQRLSAGITTTGVIFLVLIPLGWLAVYAAVQAFNGVRGFDPDNFEQRIAGIRETTGLQLPLAPELHDLESQIDRLLEAAEKGSAIAGHQSALKSLIRKVDRFTAKLEAYETVEDLADKAPPPKPPESEGEEADAEPPIPLTEQQVEEGVASLAWMRRSLQRLLDQDLQPVDSDYVSGLKQARFAYNQLLADLTGGPVTGYLARLANPSREEIEYLQRAGFDHTKDYLVSISGTVTALVGEFFLGLFILTMALYFFLADGAGMVQAVMTLSPLDNNYEQQLLDEFDSASRAVVLATFVTAVVQAALAGIGFFIAGADAVVMLMVLTAVFSMIPFIGAASVWLPVGLWLIFIDEKVGWGIFILLYGNFVVSMSDNFIKPYILHGQSNIHPLLALISIFGGVNVLGPIGILIGPMIVIFFQTVLRILHTELSRLSDEEDIDRRSWLGRLAANGGPPPAAIAGARDAEVAADGDTKKDETANQEGTDAEKETKDDS